LRKALTLAVCRLTRPESAEMIWSKKVFHADHWVPAVALRPMDSPFASCVRM